MERGCVAEKVCSCHQGQDSNLEKEQTTGAQLHPPWGLHGKPSWGVCGTPAWSPGAAPAGSAPNTEQAGSENGSSQVKQAQEWEWNDSPLNKHILSFLPKTQSNHHKAPWQDLACIPDTPLCEACWGTQILLEAARNFDK